MRFKAISVVVLYGAVGTWALSVILAAPAPAPKSWNFDDLVSGGVLKDFTVESGEWKVETDASAPSKKQILSQTAKSDTTTYNVTLVKDFQAKDLELSVKMKSILGEIDQGGGLVWRAKDGKNYYITRFNPLEKNFRVYKVEDGKRTQLGSVDLELSADWHVLRVTMVGDQIECFVDDKKQLEAKDSTFKDAGRIGLWTKADAHTHFDDLTVTAK